MKTPFTLEWYRLLLDQLPDMILVKDENSRFVWANLAFCQYHGTTVEELRAKVDLESADSDETVRHLADDRAVMSAEKPIEVFSLITAWDGSGQSIPAHILKAPFIGADGRVQGIIGSVRRARTMVHQELYEERQTLKSHLDTLRRFITDVPRPLIMLDRQLRRVAASELWEANFPGMDAIQMGERLVSDDERSRVRQFLLNAANAPNTSGPLRVELDDPELGRQIVDLYAHPWDLPVIGRGGLVLVFENLTRLLRKEAQLRLSNARIAEFGYRISHNLTGPLMTARGMANVLRDGLESGDTEGMLQVVDRLTERLDHMSGLVDKLGGAAADRVLEHVYEPVALGALVDALLQQRRAEAAARGLVLRRIGDATLHSVHTRVEAIVAALVDNGIKFSHEGEGAVVEVVIEPQGDEVRLGVVDQGIGIAPSDVPRIFDPWVRGTSKRPGNGLGLYMANLFARRLGGRMQVDSCEGPTEVSAVLPRVSQGGQG